MRIKNLSEPLVTYIRVQEIFRPFLRYKYGDFPIDLPVTSCKLYDILSVDIAANYKMKRMCYSSFSMAAYQCSFPDEGVNALFYEIPEDAYLPSEAEKVKLVPFVLPASIICGGRRVQTNKWFQLTNSGYQEFSAVLKNEFWNAFVDFDQKFNLYCYREGKKYNQEISIEKFMIKIGMDMNKEDILARYWRKKKDTDKRLSSRFNMKESTISLREQMEHKIMAEDF